ncbi:hypothetical protein NM208_g517 [Fusarium decemcellulare]|uniref:Uncharacterized protein n=1 Tax=Fusarium decemcellulare TaxID=57161 RepID=A0ACC1SZ30_9HYPO|nr:hypothetical protein NM208_g517 [Fusarium decemcellulare]
MDLMELSAADISRKCLDSFNQCLAFRPSQDDNLDTDGRSKDKDTQISPIAERQSLNERIEYRLADLNLWIDGIGALAPSKASLDSRLQERLIDLSLVKGNLIMLYQAVEDCKSLLGKQLPLEEALLDIDSALENLVSLSLAIRRTGRRSRLHKADRLFNPQEHNELKKHLECMLVLRPTKKGCRNRFVQAQLHSIGLKKRRPDFEFPTQEFSSEFNQLTVPLQDQPADVLNPMATSILSHSKSLPLKDNNVPPIISATSASIPESKLGYNDSARKNPDSSPRTEITQITASARYPRPRISSSNQQVIQCPCCCQTLPIPEVKDNDKWRLPTVIEQVAPQQPDKSGLEIYSADEHGDESAAAETDMSQSTRQTLESIETPCQSEVAPEVLLGGCRCVEIDVWNGEGATYKNDFRSLEANLPGRVSTSSNSFFPEASKRLSRFFRVGKADSAPTFEAPDREPSPEPAQETHMTEPILMHGWTLAAPCGFREVCKAIKESAFVNSDLPVIVSLEVHADLKQQEMMVKIMEDEWEDLLLDQPIEDCDPRFRLPNLEDLRNKILVKVKKSPANSIIPPALKSPSPKIEGEEMNRLSKKASLESVVDTSPTVEPESKSEFMPDITSGAMSRKIPICHMLGQLGVYTQSVHFRGFDTLEARTPAHIFSVNESRILQLDKASTQDLFKHNQRYFFRVFPNAQRVDSSKPDPLLFWTRGVQMVMLNWQHLDNGMMLNQAMFADEDGWALKPEGYQSSDRAIMTQRDTVPNDVLNLSIFIFGGQILELHGNEHGSNDRFQDIARFARAELVVGEQNYETKPSGTQSQEPQSGVLGYMMDFGSVAEVLPQLSILLLKFRDPSLSGSQLLAWSSIRLDRLNVGYRFIPLFDETGASLEEKLFVKISMTQQERSP